MDQFAVRVLQGGGNVTPQETAVLPQILEMLLREKPHAIVYGRKEEYAFSIAQDGKERRNEHGSS